MCHGWHQYTFLCIYSAACDTKQTVTITALQSIETTPSFHWCYVSMEFGAQHHSLCHLHFVFLLLFSLSCFIPLFYSVSVCLFALCSLSLSLKKSSTLPPLFHTLSFLYSFFGHFRPLSLSHALFHVPGYDVVLHLFSSICFMPSTSNLLRLRTKNASVNMLCTWIRAIKFLLPCLFGWQPTTLIWNRTLSRTSINADKKCRCLILHYQIFFSRIIHDLHLKCFTL